MKLLFFLIFFCFYGFAEAFGNKIISLPTISIDLINTFSKKDLGIDKQISVGTCLSYALNYDWSFISKTQVGFAPLKNHDSLASSIKTFLGVTYLFGINDLRVFSSLLIGY